MQKLAVRGWRTRSRLSFASSAPLKSLRGTKHQKKPYIRLFKGVGLEAASSQRRQWIVGGQRVRDERLVTAADHIISLRMGTFSRLRSGFRASADARVISVARLVAASAAARQPARSSSLC